MNIINIIKKEKFLTIKLFNLPLFSYSCDKRNEFIKIKCLLNVFYYKYDIFFRTFNFRVLGFNVLKSKLYSSYKICYFLFIPFFIKNVCNSFKNEFFNRIITKYPEYNDYYIFPCRSGEFFLLMHHFKDYLKQNNSTNYILIFTAKYHMNICRMFYPEMKTGYIEKVHVQLVSRGIKGICNIYKNKRILSPVYESYFFDVENKIRTENTHYYELLKTHLKLSRNLENYTISNKTQDKIQKIVKYILDENFVLISPETLSNKPMEKDFWKELCTRLKKEGYKIYCNAMEFYNLIPDSEAMFLTYEESIELTKYAKAVIGMRSGFIECLSQNNVPMFVLYTDFPKRKGFKPLASDKVLSGYTISKLPRVNKEKLFEYDVKVYDNKQTVIDEILMKFNKQNYTR